jgi:hypothetical protein
VQQHPLHHQRMHLRHHLLQRELLLLPHTQWHHEHLQHVAAATAAAAALEPLATRSHSLL